MTIGTLLRRGIVTVAAVAAVVWIVGSFASRSYRSLRMTILVPADAELGKGTAVVAGRATVGTVTQVGDPMWGLPLEVRTAARHRAWIPVVLAPGEAASSGAGPSLLRASLDPSDSVLTLASSAVEPLVLRRDADGSWLGDQGAGTGLVLVNGDSVRAGEPVRAGPGDILALGDTEVRFGSFGQFRPAEVRFTTRKLCPDHSGNKWFPDSTEQDQCRVRKLRGSSRLEFGGTFGLTKPILKLTPGDSEEGSLRQPDADRLALAVKRDLQTEMGEILAYLNSPRTTRPRPRTHFEHTLARVNQTLATIDSTAGSIGSTVRTLKAGMGTPDGVGPVVLGTDYQSLRVTLANAARITGPLADSTRTLVENAGLGPLLARVDTTLDSSDAAIIHLRGQIDRLAPRIELAVEGTARTIEGAEGTLVALKAAGEDIQSIKRGAQDSKRYAIGGGALLLLSQLLAGLAAVKFVF
jgi:hypothetical protein